MPYNPVTEAFTPDDTFEYNPPGSTNEGYTSGAIFYPVGKAPGEAGHPVEKLPFLHQTSFGGFVSCLPLSSITKPVEGSPNLAWWILKLGLGAVVSFGVPGAFEPDGTTRYAGTSAGIHFYPGLADSPAGFAAWGVDTWHECMKAGVWVNQYINFNRSALGLRAGKGCIHAKSAGAFAMGWSHWAQDFADGGAVDFRTASSHMDGAILQSPIPFLAMFTTTQASPRVAYVCPHSTNPTTAAATTLATCYGSAFYNNISMLKYGFDTQAKRTANAGARPVHLYAPAVPLQSSMAFSGTDATSTGKTPSATASLADGSDVHEGSGSFLIMTRLREIQSANYHTLNSRLVCSEVTKAYALANNPTGMAALIAMASDNVDTIMLDQLSWFIQHFGPPGYGRKILIPTADDLFDLGFSNN